MRAWTTAEKLTIGAISVVAIAMRWYGIGEQSFWIDEAATWSFSRLSLTELWHGMAAYEPHPPLYYTLIKAWRFLFGDGEVALRTLSMIAGALCVPVVYLIGRDVVDGEEGRWVGGTAAMLFAVNPVQIYYSQEARAYAVLGLGAAIVLYTLVWWIRRPGVLSQPTVVVFGERGSSARLIVILFVIGSALAFWMHNTAPLLVGSLVGAGAMVLLHASLDRKRALANLILCGLLVLLLWAPGLIRLVQSLGTVAGNYWIPLPSIRGVIGHTDFLLTSFGIADSLRLQLVFLAGGAVLAVLGTVAIARRSGWHVAALLCVATVLPIIVSVAASYAVTPILLPRTLIWVQVGFTVLISASVLWSSRIAVRSLCVVTLVVLMSLLLARFDSAKEPWFGLVAILSKEAMAEDALIVLPNSVQIPLEYYGAHELVDAQSVPLWDGEARYPSLEQVFGVPYVLSPEYVLQGARRAESAQGRVWVILRTAQSDPRSLALTEHLTSQRGEPELVLQFRQSGLNPEVRLLVYPPREANKQ